MFSFERMIKVWDKYHNLVAKLEKVEHDIKSRTDDVVAFKPVSYTHLAGLPHHEQV